MQTDTTRKGIDRSSVTYYDDAHARRGSQPRNDVQLCVGRAAGVLSSSASAGFASCGASVSRYPRTCCGRLRQDRSSFHPTHRPNRSFYNASRSSNRRLLGCDPVLSGGNALARALTMSAQVCAYVLQSDSQRHRFYTGLTSNLDARLAPQPRRVDSHCDGSTVAPGSVR